MRNIISKFLLKIIGRKNILDYLDIDQIKTEIEKNCISKCDIQVSKPLDSRFYGTAVVNNFQNDISNLVLGQNTHIRGELLIFKYGGKILIGENCYVGEGTRIWSGESIFIGNNVLISHNVNIIDTNSHEINFLERTERYKELISNGHWDTKGNIITSPIIIKDYAWISFGTTILKGVTIGEGAIVGAGSVVTKNVPDWTLVAGNPAKQIKTLNNAK
jgi:acetyltransferase-like isoleucine patch superfamily enzyme